MSVRPAPVGDWSETRALRASRAPSRAPLRRARRGGAVSRTGVPSFKPDVAPDIAPDMFGASPGPRAPALHRAARWGDLNRVRRLLDTRTQDVNETDANGSTALMWACQFGHDDVVEALLRRGADARARNAFNWSALEYASTSSLAGDVLFALLPEYYPGIVSRSARGGAEEAPGALHLSSRSDGARSVSKRADEDEDEDATSATSLRTRTVVAPVALSGAYGALLGDWSRYVRTDADVFSFEETDAHVAAPFARSGTEARSAARLFAVARNATRRYISSAATSFHDARDALGERREGTRLPEPSSKTPDAFPRVGAVAIAGCTRKPLGLYAGQRYEIRALFWQRRTSASDAARVSAFSADDPIPSPEHVLCAELRNPTWTPWGSIEVEVSAAELRSVRDELRWAAATAAAFAAFFVGAGALLRDGAVSVASVPSDSMAPSIRRGDAVLVDRRRASLRAVAAGDIVLFAPPPLLERVILETRGSSPTKRELFVKRVVAVAGDELEIVNGAVFRNGTRETPYATGTPVGVNARASSAVVRANGGGSPTTNPCPADVCKAGAYDLRPTRVPPGRVFVLGDNRGGSVDGHVWGYLPLENVRGVVRFRVGPPYRFGPLKETPSSVVRDHT